MHTHASERSGAARLAAAGDAPEDWDRVGASFQEHGRQHLWRRHSDAVHVALLERWLAARAGRVLETDLFDEAVGEGLVPTLSARAESVVGIDVAPVTVAGARRRHGALRAVVADVRRLPFAEGVFDTVVSNSTLDHFRTVAEIDDALRELARVLRPGGELILTLDNRANPLVWLRNALPLGLLRATGIVPYYVGATLGPRSAVAHLRAAGLHVVERAAVLHCPRMPAVAVAWLLDRVAGPRLQRVYLRALARCEALGALPTRYATGYFVAARAVKRAP